jgi:hypothetical protein
MKALNSDSRPFYSIQSVSSIYLYLNMAIYSFYLLLEVVMLIRITILNRLLIRNES